ncbi:MAG: endonuclease/exonuclease/phosphatase family protein [Nitrospinae bacterium]|nr:endonuclease/exonuclease/phosphatase family protein [Nitrospinota bacterium]
MIERFELMLRRVRRWLSRSDWGAFLLGLSKSKGTGTEPGLVLVQIDGLSRNQLEKAMKKGRMPFLNRLVRKEGYGLHTLYSGLPTSTPAIQGELFYGVKGIVPAFGFMDRKTGKVTRMFDPEPAAEIQKCLERQGEGLLRGGSSYANIYSGGAEESHFCPATFGWSHLKKGVNPFALALLVLFHGASLVRTAALLLLEIVLAVADCVRGLIDGRDLWREIKFVPLRVAISVLLRDLAAIGAAIDATRGLPVVHVNFIGYDEQAHRRGPSSNFAHWSLKGIDDAIKRIFNAARRSPLRDYDVWIYSDHGQEETVPYPLENGRTVHETVAAILDRPGPPPKLNPMDKRGTQFERSRWLGGSFLNWLFGEPEKETGDRSPLVVAMGSLGHVYTTGDSPGPEERDRIARRLIAEGGIPMVLAPAQPDSAAAWTAAGAFSLPGEAGKVFGPDHPFLEEMAGDLVALCHHPDSGDLILSGWRPDKRPLSFPLEHGSHSGPGREETRAFALLPAAAPLFQNGRDYLRPLDLRETALYALGRRPSPKKPRFRQPRRDNVPLRIMTYNVHLCRGMDGKLSPARIAKVIAHYDPDIVALQELDKGRPRTGEVDQAHVIARDLEMEFHFHPAIQVEEEAYGDAILSRYPMRLVYSGRLPGLPGRAGAKREPRGALWVAVTVDGREIQIFNTHLGLKRSERSVQVDALLGPQWAGSPECRGPIAVCGDFNALPRSAVCKRFRGRFLDAQTVLRDHRPQRTFFGRYPMGRIDHVFVSPNISIHGIEVPRTALTQIASDHLPLIVEIGLPPAAKR